MLENKNYKSISKNEHQRIRNFDGETITIHARATMTGSYLQ